MNKGGRCLLQMGGKGNAADIIKVLDTMILEHKWQPYFKDFSFSYGFHDIDTYTPWLPYTERVPETRKNEFITELINRYLDQFPRDSRGQIHANMVLP